MSASIFIVAPPSPSYLLTGQVRIPGTGLYHYKARAYHLGLGRFLQPDPLGMADGPNLYAYVGNDPVNLIDPLGLQAADMLEEISVTGLRARRDRIAPFMPSETAVQQWCGGTAIYANAHTG